MTPTLRALPVCAAYESATEAKRKAATALVLVRKPSISSVAKGRSDVAAVVEGAGLAVDDVEAVDACATASKRWFVWFCEHDRVALPGLADDERAVADVDGLERVAVRVADRDGDRAAAGRDAASGVAPRACAASASTPSRSL